jgi:D-aspartate oxidase
VRLDAPFNAILKTKGLGVIGLTTALKIQEEGSYQVTVIAEVLPSDPKTIKYTSHWAVSFFTSP